MSQTAGDRLDTLLAGELALRLANDVIGACAVPGVVLMPLKGVLFLGRWPALRGKRDLVDVDFLVRSSEREALTQVLRTLGFEAGVHSSAGSTFVSEVWPLSIDVHYALFPHGLFRVGTEEVFARAELDSSLFAGTVARMSDMDLFAHLIGHFAKGRASFGDDKSLGDIRWLLRRGVFGIGDADALGAHLRALGLQRAAGYVLGHESFRGEPVARALVSSLRLSAVDRATIAVAHLATSSHGDVPRWWTPHLLDHSLLAGSRSMCVHADEGARRALARLTERSRPSDGRNQGGVRAR